MRDYIELQSSVHLRTARPAVTTTPSENLLIVLQPVDGKCRPAASCNPAREGRHAEARVLEVNTKFALRTAGHAVAVASFAERDALASDLSGECEVVCWKNRVSLHYLLKHK